jgi:hypothetical protein
MRVGLRAVITPETHNAVCNLVAPVVTASLRAASCTRSMLANFNQVFEAWKVVAMRA